MWNGNSMEGIKNNLVNALEILKNGALYVPKKIKKKNPKRAFQHGSHFPNLKSCY
jgi:hypothetical protein